MDIEEKRIKIYKNRYEQKCQPLQRKKLLQNKNSKSHETLLHFSNITSSSIAIAIAIAIGCCEHQ
jgi:hypothetical protein